MSMGNTTSRPPLERHRAADGSVHTTYHMWSYANQFGHGRGSLR